MSDPDYIWLEPVDHEADPYMGRSWCAHPLDCDECGAESVRYVRADIAEARVKELEALAHKQRDLESQLQGEINHLEAENAELRAELFCNQMCVRFWPGHHSSCRLLAIRLNRIK